jgi:hypothetical protein
MEYYTYAYLREDRTPYYIGKGKGTRIHSSNRRLNLPPKERRVLLKQNLTEKEAFKHEVYMIAVFGRKDLGTGILHNKTNGGEGGSGRVLTEEHKRKIGERNKDKLKGRNLSEETKKKIGLASKGRKSSEETRKKLSASLKNNTNGTGNTGKKHTEEFREHLRKLKTKPDCEVSAHALWMREYKKERPKYSNEEWKELSKQKQIERKTKKYKITFETGNIIVVHGLTKFAKENGYSSGLYNVMNGTYKKHKDIVAVEKLDPTP